MYLALNSGATSCDLLVHKTLKRVNVSGNPLQFLKPVAPHLCDF